MKGILFVFSGACSYGVLSTIVVLAYTAGFSLNDVVGSQMVIGALLLWLLTFGHLKQIKRCKPTLNQTLKLMIAGISTGTTGLLYYASLQYLSPALAVVLFFQFTWMGLILESILNRKRPQKSQLIALIPIIIGTVIATNLLSEGVSHLNWQGVVFGLLAALSNTVLIFVSGRVAVNVEPILRSTLMVTGGAIFTSIVVPPTFLLNWDVLTQLLISYGILLAFFGSAFSTWMFAKGAPSISTSLAAILSAMQLPVTMVLSIVILDIPVTLLQLVGIAAILLGVVISQGRPSNSKADKIEGLNHGY